MIRRRLFLSIALVLSASIYGYFSYLETLSSKAISCPLQLEGGCYQFYRGTLISADEPLSLEKKASIDKKVEDERNKRRLEDEYWASLTQRQKDNVKVFAELLSTSVDDVMRNGWTEDITINYQQRQKFFTTKGWSEYQAYLKAQKERLLKLQGGIASSPESSMNVWGIIETEKQKFTEDKSQKNFVSGGHFSDGYYDARTIQTYFKIRISYQENKKTHDPIINAWQVEW